MDQQNEPKIVLNQPAYQEPKGSSLGLIIAIVATFLITGGAVFAWQQTVVKNNEAKNREIVSQLSRQIADSKIKDVSENKDSNSTNGTINPTSNNQDFDLACHYRNSMGYEFDFPASSYYLYDMNDTSANGRYSLNKRGVDFYNRSADYPFYVSISMIGNKEDQNLTFDNYVTKVITNSYAADGARGSINFQSIKSKENYTNNNGIKGYKIYVNLDINTNGNLEIKTIGPVFVLDISQGMQNAKDRLGSYYRDTYYRAVRIEPSDYVIDENVEEIAKYFKF